MTEAEIYSNFYEGMSPESKDQVNSASGGIFSRMRVSEAKRIIGRLIDAKKAYDDPRTHLLRKGTANAATVAVQTDDKMEARIEKMEKAILNALEKSRQPAPAPPETMKATTSLEEMYTYYGPPGEAEYQSQVNAVGSWNPGKHRDAPWRDHPIFLGTVSAVFRYFFPIATYNHLARWKFVCVSWSSGREAMPEAKGLGL